MYITWYRSEIGPLILTSDGKNLTGLYIEGQKYFLDGVSDDLEEVDDLEIFWKIKLWLTHYFAGKNPNPRKLQFLPSGTSFRQVVWQELLNIPYGDVITYKELGKRVAKRLGRSSMSSQAIGGAVGHNPISIIIPCHRVVGSDGSLTGYAGGLEKKAFLLELEKNTKGEFYE